MCPALRLQVDARDLPHQLIAEVADRAPWLGGDGRSWASNRSTAPAGRSPRPWPGPRRSPGRPRRRPGPPRPRAPPPAAATAVLGSPTTTGCRAGPDSGGVYRPVPCRGVGSGRAAWAVNAAVLTPGPAAAWAVSGNPAAISAVNAGTVSQRQILNGGLGPPGASRHRTRADRLGTRWVRPHPRPVRPGSHRTRSRPRPPRTRPTACCSPLRLARDSGLVRSGAGQAGGTLLTTLGTVNGSVTSSQ